MLRRALTVMVTTVVALGASVVLSAAGADTARRPFFVDRQTEAQRAKATHPGDAAKLEEIAGVAQAKWITRPDLPAATTRATVADYVERAVDADATPLMVVYGAPHRDCGGHTAGGADDLNSYRQFVAAIRDGIGSHGATLVIEPDGLSGVTCLNATQAVERVAAIGIAVNTFATMGAVNTYVDVGHSRWLSPIAAAGLLNKVGVQRIRGFSLNVSNFFTTAEEQSYGERVVALLGGNARYVIDTSRNGNGPASADDPQNWCNPRGRALGTRPTRTTSAPHNDAYLWIKHPGESDGACRPGEPASGLWFHSWAMELIAES